QGSLIAEALQRRGIGCQRGGQDLDGDVAMQTELVGPINDPHAATANFAAELEARQASLWRSRECFASGQGRRLRLRKIQVAGGAFQPARLVARSLQRRPAARTVESLAEIGRASWRE